MNPKERALTALKLGTPDFVPTFELVFLLEEEFLNKKRYSNDEMKNSTGAELDKMLNYNAEIIAEFVEKLDYSIVRADGGNDEHRFRMFKILDRLIGHRCLIDFDMDPTYSIPSGSRMMDFTIRLFEHPDEVKEAALKGVKNEIERAKRAADAGAAVTSMCADYCFNNGPFLSPKMFSEFVTPYLKMAIDGFRSAGLITIKHTDGDIMPILDDLIYARPDALHSLDPMAGVKLPEVKQRTKGIMALCGNVDCSILQSSTIEAVMADAERSLRDGMPGGGYIFCSSNCAFKGVPIENYLAMLEVRKRLGSYTGVKYTEW